MSDRKADIELLAGIEGGGQISGKSGQKILNQLTNIIGHINKKHPFEYKIEVNQKNINDFKAKLSELTAFAESEAEKIRSAYAGVPVFQTPTDSGNSGKSGGSRDTKPKVLAKDTIEYYKAYSKLASIRASLDDKLNKYSSQKDGAGSAHYAELEQQKNAYNSLSESLSNGNMLVSDFNLKMAEADYKTREAVRGIKQFHTQAATPVKADPQKEYNKQLAKVNSLLVSAKKSLKDWSQAKNGDSSEAYHSIERYVEILEEMRSELIDSGEALEDFDNKFDSISSGVKSSSSEIRLAGENAKTLGDRLKGIGEKFGIFFSAAEVLQKIVQLTKQMIENVTDIDTAMTELRKVTDETNQTYSEFLDNAAVRAKKLGATVSEVVESSADYARLGHNLNDASNLADVAIIYKNVGDGISDISEASESIISTMQAFNIQAKDAMSIVDKFNIAGNNFAISSGGIGDALLNSAAALSAAGNTLDESIAMIAAANETIQNPEKVGTALKTVSMYIRAAKTEAEEAGIATDGMANSVSELREKMLKLTGGHVDIMTGDQYKSTVKVLRDLSQVWEKLSDTTKTNIAEILGGGVRNANVVYSLINNFETVEEVLNTTADAAGSALEENEKYLDSISGKTALVQASFEQLSTTAIESSTIKNFLDIVTALLDASTGIVDRFGLLPSILGAASMAMSALGTETILTPFTRGNDGLHFKLSDQFDLKFGNLTKQIDIYNQKMDELVSTGTKIEGKEGKTFFDVISGSIDDASDSMSGYLKQLGGAQASTAGYIGYLIKQEASTLAVKGAQIALNAVYSLAATAIITLVTQGISYLLTYQQKQIDQAKEATSVYNDQVKSSKQYRKELVDLREKLASNTISQEEAAAAREKILSIQEALIDNYGIEARGIDLLTMSVDELNEEINKLSASGASKYLTQNADVIEDAIEAMESSQKYYVNNIDWGAIPAEARVAFEELVANYEDVVLNTNVDPSTGFRTSALEITAKNAQAAETIISALANDIRMLSNRLLVDGIDLDSVFQATNISWDSYFGSMLDKLDETFDKYQDVYETQIQAKIASGSFQNAYAEMQTYDSLMQDIINLQDEYQSAVTGTYQSSAEREAAITEATDKINAAKDSFIRLYGSSANKSFDRGVYEYLLGLIESLSSGDIDSFIDGLEDIPTTSVNGLVEEFGKMADAVERSNDALTELDEKLSEPDYDANYNKDAEYFKMLADEIAAGKFGSKKYDFLTGYFGVSDMSVDQVKEWANATGKYYESADKGAQEFLSTIEELNKAGTLSRDVMSYDSETGDFWFDPTKISEAADVLSGFTEDTLSNIINLIRTYIPDWIITMPVKTVVEVDGEQSEMVLDMELGELQRIATENGITLEYDDNGAILNIEDLLEVLQDLPDDAEIGITLNGETIDTIDAIRQLVSWIRELSVKSTPKVKPNLPALNEVDQIYAGGTNRAYSGPALLGDEYSPTGEPRPELVVSNGVAYLAGTNGPVIQNLKSGDRVYSYSDTMRILSGQKIGAKIPAFDGGNISFNSGGGSSVTSTSTYDSSTDKLHDVYKKRIAELDHAIFLLEKNGSSSSKVISVYKELMQAAHDEAERLRALGVADNDETIIELQQQWWEYHDAVDKMENESLENAKDAAEELVEYRIDMLKQELENRKDSLNKELDALSDFYDDQRDMLKKSKDEEDYIKEQNEKRKAVSDIHAEIDYLQFNDSAWAQKRILELQADLAEATEDLNEFESERALENALTMLDEQQQAQELTIQGQIDALDEKLNDPNALYNQALSDIQNNTLALYEEMVKYNNRYGSGNPEDVAAIWEEAYVFFQSYKQMHGTSYKGIDLVNATGYASGTNYSTAGIHKLFENGDEYVFTSGDGTKYRMFGNGEKVLNAGSTDFLYNFAQTRGGALLGQLQDVFSGMYAKLMNGMVGSSSAHQIRMGDIIINGNADEKTVSQIRREQRSSVEFLLKELNRLK